MQDESRFSLSLGHALTGLRETINSEANFRIHLAVGALVVMLGIWLRLNPLEWSIIIIAVIGVLILEIVNSVLERVVDMLKPRLHPMVREVKDMMAAAVLLAAIGAALVGSCIFLPRLTCRFRLAVFGAGSWTASPMFRR